MILTVSCGPAVFAHTSVTDTYYAKIMVKEAPLDGEIVILGHTFNGLKDISEAVGVTARITQSYFDKKRQISRKDPTKPVSGIYVLELYEPYPCFDAEDYANENRKYHNFFFSTEPFTDEKINQIAKLSRRNGFLTNELVSDQMPAEYLPAVYFKGNPRDKLLVAFEERK